MPVQNSVLLSSVHVRCTTGNLDCHVHSQFPALFFNVVIEVEVTRAVGASTS